MFEAVKLEQGSQRSQLCSESMQNTIECLKTDTVDVSLSLWADVSQPLENTWYVLVNHFKQLGTNKRRQFFDEIEAWHRYCKYVGEMRAPVRYAGHMNITQGDVFAAGTEGDELKLLLRKFGVVVGDIDPV